MAKLAAWLAGPMALLRRIGNRIESWRDVRRQKKLEKAPCTRSGSGGKERKKARRVRPQQEPEQPQYTQTIPQSHAAGFTAPPASHPIGPEDEPETDPAVDTPPWEQEIPIRTLEDTESTARPSPRQLRNRNRSSCLLRQIPIRSLLRQSPAAKGSLGISQAFNRDAERAAGRSTYDSQELKDIAASIRPSSKSSTSWVPLYKSIPDLS